MFADYHVHTKFSDDSAYPMEQVVKDAIAMKMDEICFTDHVDYGIKEDWDYSRPAECRRRNGPMNVDYPRYFALLKELRHTYEGQITIRSGLEFGMQMHTIPRYQALVETYPLDFMILSVHQVEDQEFWTQDFQKNRSQKEYNERYYEEMLGLVKACQDYSVLGHMDLIVRYDENGVYPFEKIREIVSEILKVVIADGKGIEFNTSWRRYGLKDTTPSVDILKLYRELGGEIITIGSDSHAPAHLGSGILETKEFLKSLGFRYFCTYADKKPLFHTL